MRKLPSDVGVRFHVNAGWCVGIRRILSVSIGTFMERVTCCSCVVSGRISPKSHKSVLSSANGFGMELPLLRSRRLFTKMVKMARRNSAGTMIFVFRKAFDRDFWCNGVSLRLSDIGVVDIYVFVLNLSGKSICVAGQDRTVCSNTTIIWQVMQRYTLVLGRKR